MSIMNKVSEFLEKYLAPIGAKIGNQIHLKALRDGMISTIPLTVVGGMFLILGTPPVTKGMEATNFFNKFILSWGAWAAANKDAILTPYRVTFALMGLFVAFAVAYFLAKNYKMDPLSNAVVSATTFLMVSAPIRKAVFAGDIAETMDLSKLSKISSDLMVTKFLDSKGMFTAMLIALLTVEIARFLVKKGIVIKMPEGVPPAISNSFNALAPMTINIILFHGLNLFLQNTQKMILPEAISKFMTPAVAAADSIWFVLGMLLIAQLLWIIGMHGNSIINTITIPLLLTNMVDNAAAVAASTPLPHIWIKPLWMATITIGGAGGTLGLAFLLLWSKSRQLKTIGKISIVPAMFNVNEPIIFGMPIMMNPVMAIPFIITPMINAIITHFAVVSGLLSRPFADLPWTTPAPIAAGLTTMDIRGAILVCCLIVLDLILYYPFFKTFEKTMLKQEESETDSQTLATAK